VPGFTAELTLGPASRRYASSARRARLGAVALADDDAPACDSFCCAACARCANGEDTWCNSCVPC
jgi:hypothetical protein